MMKDQPLIKRILDRYRTSGDFNGLYFTAEEGEDRIEEAIGLVQDGLVQVVSEEDYLNPHIRPWPSQRSIGQQIESLRSLDSGRYGVCLYPMATALKAHRTRRKYPDEPFRQAMADGRGTLELAYFRFDVLEQYRNDPRFRFEFHDFGARTVVSDEVYLDAAEPEHDKIIMDHIGFAYDLSEYDRNDPNSPIVRRVCAFYGDLSKLSPNHQQRWRTYEVEDDQPLSPHPVWWAQQMGHWPDGLGPFDKLFQELKAWNSLHRAAFGEDLLRHTSRPSGFGWILRPSQAEWDHFVHQLDKLLSENLRSQALDSLGAPSVDKQGKTIGSLNRLALVLESRSIPAGDVRNILKPLRDVRQARQRPAHSLRTDVTDSSFVHRQVELMARVNETIDGLRRFWQTHPANTDWSEPEYLSESSRSYRL